MGLSSTSNRNRIKMAAYLSAAVLIGAGLGAFTGYSAGYNRATAPAPTSAPSTSTSTPSHLPMEIATALDDLWLTLTQQSLVQPSVEKAKAKLLKAMVDSLDDPYSSWLTPDEASGLSRNIDSQYGGMGMDTLVFGPSRYIENILAGGAAEVAGLKPGDRIVEMNGVAIGASNELFEGAKALSPTRIALVIKRAGVTKQITLEPFPYNEPDVVYRGLDKGLFLIDVNTFSDSTLSQFQRALDAYEAGNYQSMIVDVRNNFGGYMPVCHDMISLLVDDQIIAYELGNDGLYKGVERTVAQRIGVKGPVPMAILINGESYSAAELFAQSMNVYGGAMLVGETTYGKGTQQALYTGEDGTLRLSVSRFSAKNMPGAQIHEVGVKPTHEMKVDYENYSGDVILERAKSLLP